MEQVLFQTSLIAAFVAGIVALFAPCCISFLLPAYLGSVFKEKEKILLMTLVFGLGIFTVMMPAVLGVAALSKALFVYHDEIYIIGGFVMLAAALVTFLGIKLPMPNLQGREAGKHDPLSIFNPLVKAKIGDEIIINYDGITYRYIIRHTAEVDPEKVEVLAQSYDRYELTLVTCTPLGTYLRRFVARAELVN